MTNKTKKSFALRSTALALTIALTASLAFGLGSRIPNQDAAAIARGNAFVATADNPSAIYYNPAGITQLEGQHLQFGALTYLNIYADYESPTGAKTENNTEFLPVPQLNYTFTPKDSKFSFGLGIYSPFGLGMKWPDNAPFRTSGLQADLTYATINPVIAWRPLETLSIAIGPTINYSKARLRQGLAPIPLGDEFSFKGDAWDYGFNAGILWQPHPKWSFGFSYRSETTMDYDGNAYIKPPASATATIPTKTHLNFPQIVIGGVSYRPNTNWNFEFDVDWTDWSTTKNAAIDGIFTLPLNWQSSFFYEFGVTRQLGKGYYVSAGYFFCEASTPEEQFTPFVPDTNLHVGSFGFGRNGEHWTWAIATQIIASEERTVNSVSNPSVNGKYSLFTPTLSFSVGYHW